MLDLVITGASRGIGRALALALAGRRDARLVLVARDAARLETLAREIAVRGGDATAVVGDLGELAAARALGERLAALVGPGAALVHNAGLWPTTLDRTTAGLERSFVVNHLGPLAMQGPLLAARRLSRIMVVSAGLIEFGCFDAQRTPTGRDFSAFRTYCTTKLCFALAMREVSAERPDVDVVVLHPGVVRTDLGVGPGFLGRVISLAKWRMESPETCAARLARVLERAPWSPPGEARWLFEESERPWPAAARNLATQRAVRETTVRLLGERAIAP